MDKKWLLGFIEGSGCFSVVIRKSKNHVGFQTIADFTLKLPKEQESLLREIRNFLGVGGLYKNKSTALLKVTKLEDSKKLVMFFSKQPFLSKSKRNEFRAWKRCVQLMSKGSHHTPEGILEIARLRDEVHHKRLWNKKNYCSLRLELDPCHLATGKAQLPVGCRVCWGSKQAAKEAT